MKMSGPELYLGKVMHHRLRPAVNRFTYPVYFCRLPLRQLDAVQNRVFWLNRFNLLSFHFADHGARDGSHPLAWIEAQLAAAGIVAEGEIVLHCFPRVLGYVFNPVSFWFCRNRAGQTMAVLAEVNNTFGERHAYLLHHPDGRPLEDGEVLTAAKRLHVSPFCAVEGGYRFRFFSKAQSALVRIDYADAEGDLIYTAVSGQLAPWTVPALLKAFFGYPWMTLGVIARIHWQAVKLIAKRVPFFGKRPPSRPLNPLQENPS